MHIWELWVYFHFNISGSKKILLIFCTFFDNEGPARLCETDAGCLRSANPTYCMKKSSWRRNGQWRHNLPTHHTRKYPLGPDVEKHDFWNCVWYICILMWLLSWRGVSLFCTTNKCHSTTTTTRAVARPLHNLMMTMRQLTKRLCRREIQWWLNTAKSKPCAWFQIFWSSLEEFDVTIHEGTC